MTHVEGLGSEHSDRRRKVFVVGIDSPNQELLLRWIAEGHLPNIEMLQQRSAQIDISSIKSFSNEHCWLPLLTGQSRDRWNHWLDNWDAQEYRFGEASIFDWLQAPVFYALGERRRVIAFDLVAPIVDGVNGIQVSGWASELNECFPSSQPAALWGELVARHGHDPKLTTGKVITNQVSEREGLSYTVPSIYDADLLDAYAATLIRSVERRTAACLDVLAAANWDLFIALYSESHTAGHTLWHLSQPHPLNAIRPQGKDPLLEVFKATDASIGTLLREAGEETVIIFHTIDEMVADSLENARALLLPEFLYRWNFPGKAALAEGRYGTEPPPPRLDYRDHWKHEVWRLRTPIGEAELESPVLQESRGDPMSWCPGNWYRGLWPSMQAFALPTVADGNIRINVRGREAQGVVSPEDYPAICDRLTEDLLGLLNARTGRPMVRDVIRVRETPLDTDPKKSPADLVVVFHEDGPVDTIDSPKVGRIGPVPYFRSGSHQSHGAELWNLMYVSGAGITPGKVSGGAELQDIPVTILDLMGIAVPGTFDGVPRVRLAARAGR